LCRMPFHFHRMVLAERRVKPVESATRPMEPGGREQGHRASVVRGAGQGAHGVAGWRDAPAEPATGEVLVHLHASA
jgi:hypothetical protein